jgi:hypothetical protein
MKGTGGIGQEEARRVLKKIGGRWRVPKKSERREEF